MLTPRQQDLLDFLTTHAATSKIGPSFSDMANALGLSSPSSVHHLLTSLEERGYIRRSPNRARAITLIANPPQISATSDGFSTSLPIVGKIDLRLRLSTLRRTGPSIALPPEIVTRGDFFALRIQSRHIHHDRVRHGDICVFDRRAMPKPGDIGLIRPPGVDYALMCSYIIRRDTKIFEPIDTRASSASHPAADVQVLGSAVAVVRRL